ncbi:hypothetical protein DC498_00590 [Terrimonas sp.]|nr:hypothetical protein DC498_00590 [Terrimonas sp.]
MQLPTFKMITNRKLKTLTIISHGFIIVGAGHGIVCLFIFEIFSLINITKENLNFSFNTGENHFSVIGLTILWGQASLIFSILNRNKKLKNGFQIVGLCLLWLSIVYFIYDITKDHYTHIALITVVPFATCTIITFAGKLLMKIYRKILDT